MAFCCTAAIRSNNWPSSPTTETCYLLLNGELPTAEQKAQFVAVVKNHTMVHEQLKTFSTVSAVTPTRWPSCVV